MSKTSVLLLLCFQLAALFSDRATAAEEVVVLTGEWSPYSTRLDDGRSSGRGGAHGLVAEIVASALEQMGMEPVFRFHPWPEVLDRLKRGEGTFAFPFRPTDERRADFEFSRSLIETRGVVFYNILSIPRPGEIDSIGDLEPYRIGFVETYAYGPEIESLPARRPYEDERRAFSALAEGEIDLLPAERLVGEKILRRFHPDAVHRVSRLRDLDFEVDHRLVVRRDHPRSRELIERFDAALADLVEWGLVADLMNSYGAAPDQPVRVKLVGPTSYPMVVGTLDKDADEGFLIPRGTAALVVEWSPLFERQGDFDAHQEMFERTRVKLLEGPLEDTVLWVPNIFLSLDWQPVVEVR